MKIDWRKCLIESIWRILKDDEEEMISQQSKKTKLRELKNSIKNKQTKKKKSQTINNKKTSITIARNRVT